MNPLRLITKPEYLYRPGQVVRRIKRLWNPPKPVETVTLPWGAPLTVRVGENVGNDIYYYGIFDRIVPEAIWRLLDPRETALDVGANIGQNTSAMAYRSGSGGKVFAFEPHPEILNELRQNIMLWNREKMAALRIEPVALGMESGQAVLADGAEFETNRGSAALTTTGASPNAGRTYTVLTQKLDHYLAEIPKVGVCKIDVEGHELSVLNGASATLEQRAIRDIIFEDFNPMPSPVVCRLRDSGYSVYAMHETWLKPQLIPLDQIQQRTVGFSYNFLATLAPERAIARFRPMGWRCLLPSV